MCKGCGCFKKKEHTQVVADKNEHVHGGSRHSHPHDGEHEHDPKTGEIVHKR